MPMSKKFGQQVKPRINSPSITLPPSLLGQVMDLDECLYELQETTDRLDYILVHHTNAPDGIAYNQATLHNLITNMQSFLNQHIFVVNQKVDDLLRMCSITHRCALKGVPLTAAEQPQCANSATHLIRAASRSSQSHI